jgi:hypothetical protein
MILRMFLRRNEGFRRKLDLIENFLEIVHLVTGSNRSMKCLIHWQ